MSAHVVIIGGGITGLAALEHITRTAPEMRVSLLESSSRLGGHICTHRDSGFVMEAGPDVILSAKPAALQLARRVGLGDRIQGTSTRAKGSYILSPKGLKRIPDGLSGLVPSKLGAFVTTPLLSPFTKARVALDYVIPARRRNDDESIERFVVRRLGRGMYEGLVEPLLSGISAGDGARLSMESMFPQLRAFERDHGGLIRGMLAGRRKPKAPTKAGRGAPQMSVFASFPGGLQELVDATARCVESRDVAQERVRIITDAPVAQVRRAHSPAIAGDGAHYVVVLQDDRELDADAVILAAPAYATSAMVERLDPTLADLLGDISYASMVTMSLAFRTADVPRPLDATGYVVPRVSRRPVLACTWTSAKFDGRAPDGSALFRLFIGGVGRGSYESESNELLTSLARAELGEVIGITAEPTLVHINRFQRAMPQYNVGHASRMASIATQVAQLPGIELAGAAYDGLGIPDCVRSGVIAAERAIVATGANAFTSLASSL